MTFKLIKLLKPHTLKYTHTLLFRSLKNKKRGQKADIIRPRRERRNETMNKKKKKDKKLIKSCKSPFPSLHIFLPKLFRLLKDAI